MRITEQTNFKIGFRVSMSTLHYLPSSESMPTDPNTHLCGHQVAWITWESRTKWKHFKRKKNDLVTGRIIKEKRTKLKSLRCRGKENIRAVLVNRAPMEGFIGFKAAVPYLPNGGTLIQLMLKLYCYFLIVILLLL